MRTAWPHRDMYHGTARRKLAEMDALYAESGAPPTVPRGGRSALAASKPNIAARKLRRRRAGAGATAPRLEPHHAPDPSRQIQPSLSGPGRKGFVRFG